MSKQSNPEAEKVVKEPQETKPSVFVEFFNYYGTKARLPKEEFDRLKAEKLLGEVTDVKEVTE